MLTYPQAVLLGLLQGISELFPISSLGHSVLVPQILHWQLDQASSQFVAFVVVTHLATALVLLGFFWRDWVRITVSMLRSLYLRRIDAGDTYAKLGWLLVVGTIPAGILGLLLEEELQTLFGAGTLVAAMLILNGLILWGAELLRTRAYRGEGSDAEFAKLSYPQAFGIGIAQSLALVPGISRTGSAMTGGLLSGLSHESSARFAFLLATPIIFAAAVLKVPDIAAAGVSFVDVALVGALCAAIAAYVSVRFLVSYFKTKTLTPFAAYCVLAGASALLLLAR